MGKKCLLIPVLLGISINIIPQHVDFTASDACFGETNLLHAITNIPANSIQNYYWDLDNDGYYDDTTGLDISYYFSKPGTFQVGLMILTLDNAEHFMDTTKPVIVHPLPLVEFKAEMLCQGVHTRFTDK